MTDEVTTFASNGLVCWLATSPDVGQDRLPATLYNKQLVDNLHTAYVAVREGHEFGVAVSLPNVLEAELTSGQILAPTFTTRQDLLCDGQLVSSLIDRPNSHYGFLRQSEIEDGVARKLFFAKLESTTDEEQACTDPRRIDGLGCIRLEVRRVNELRDDHSGPAVNEEIGGPVLFPEELMNAGLAAVVAYGDPMPAKKRYSRVKFEDLPGETERPSAIFEFHYRSEEWLKVHGFMSTTPSITPPPQSASSPVGAGSPTLKNALVEDDRQRFDSLWAAIQPVKREYARPIKQEEEAVAKQEEGPAEARSRSSSRYSAGSRKVDDPQTRRITPDSNKRSASSSLSSVDSLDADEPLAKKIKSEVVAVPFERAG